MRLLFFTHLGRVLALEHGAYSLVVAPAGAADLTPVVAGMTPALRGEAVTGTPGVVRHPVPKPSYPLVREIQPGQTGR